MPSTPAALCNIALGRIGQRQFIQDLDDSSVEAATCKVFYEDALKAVLCAVPWQFATGRQVLAELTVTRTNWDFVYSLPDDSIFARYIAVEGATEPRPDQRIPFALEHDSTAGKVLVTDKEDAELVYTRFVEDVNLFEPLFVDALAWKLAGDLALAIPIKPQLGLKIAEWYTMTLGLAAAANFRQSQARAEPDASYIRARR